MSIWVDGDACPKVIKEILFRAAIRTKTPVILVANQMLYTPPSPFIKSIQVASGFDVADAHIVARAQLGDLVGYSRDTCKNRTYLKNTLYEAS
jgi:uncharacterized protein